MGGGAHFSAEFVTSNVPLHVRPFFALKILAYTLEYFP